MVVLPPFCGADHVSFVTFMIGDVA